ncbi:MAG: sulfotransferase, partial [Bacteroidales bacterium]
MKLLKDTKKPEFFLIGAPKCGTSSLARYLDSHPDVHFSYPKEPNYFNTDFSKKQRMFTDETLYLNQCFHKAADKNIAGEGSVWYLYSKEAVPNILKFQPDAKFIVMLRNPVDVAYAMHSTHLRNKVNENVDDFKKAWDLQEIRM